MGAVITQRVPCVKRGKEGCEYPVQGSGGLWVQCIEWGAPCGCDAGCTWLIYRCCHTHTAANMTTNATCIEMYRLGLDFICLMCRLVDDEATASGVFY
ncbi:hypothetical protein GDO81_012683 [Engystomops pustulosus]|uniref:Uncharacterized protein n=1 Tax=Engystomops pustulosus TaxID=76066 RepID=A0AAV7AU07_ENGPU|nr:hypothetical protein GDO81_012683 [Engystomops pustulosus]